MSTNMDRFREALSSVPRPVSGRIEMEVNKELSYVYYRVDEADQITWLRIISQRDDMLIKLADLDAEERARVDAAISRDAAAERQITD